MKLTWLLAFIQTAWLPWLAWSHDFYHMKSMRIFELPADPSPFRNDSYFGYSVTYDIFNKRLIASAPRANNIGRVYTCDIEQKNCSSLKIMPDLTRDYANYDHDYWLGATVAAGSNFIVTCAPRVVDASKAYDNHLGSYAMCYRSSGNELNLMPSLSNTEKEPFDRPEREMDSFGWSIHVSNSDSILIGGPAMYTGRAMVYKTYSAHPKAMHPKAKYNFGYSVTIGKFVSDKDLYAVGSTYGSYGEGSVEIFNAKNFQLLRKLNKNVDLDVVGSMFGAVLCAAKMSGNRDDLIVGAPAYASKQKYNVGAVYVYLHNSPGPKFKRKIQGQSSGSFFGSAIVSVGDLNGDSKDEIAIAAPFEEDGRGAVYLYSGAHIMSSEPEQTLKCLQKIQPTDFGPQSMLGLSISSFKDYDDNGCNELAIGAPGVNKVAFLRCMAAVTIKMYAVFPNLQKRGKDDFFNFKSCMNVTYPEKPNKIKANVDVLVQLSHLHAKLKKSSTDGTITYRVPLDTKPEVYCQEVGVDLPPTGNYDLYISYTISAKLVDSPIDDESFNPSKVILGDKSILSISGSVWAADCKSKKGCEPLLSLNVTSSIRDNFLTIGASKSENISMKIKNEGDTAYSACLRVRTEGVPIRRLPSKNCERVTGEENFIKCVPRVALRTGKEWDTQNIELGTSRFSSTNKEFSVHMELCKFCDNLESCKNYTTKTVLKADPSGFNVKGLTLNYPNDIINMTRLEVTIGKQIEHRYIVTNNGQTKWENVRCNVIVKKSPYLIISHDAPVLVQSGDCSIKEDSPEKLLVECTLAEVFKNIANHIYIHMDIKAGSLVNVLENENVTIQTDVTIFLDEKEIHQSIATTLTLELPTVPWWMIVCASIVGLLIIILIALILHECGFLRRNNQKKLKELRDSVRRQTIRRSMMNDERRRIISQAVDIANEGNSECLHNVGSDDEQRRRLESIIRKQNLSRRISQKNPEETQKNPEETQKNPEKKQNNPE